MARWESSISQPPFGEMHDHSAFAPRSAYFQRPGSRQGTLVVPAWRATLLRKLGQRSIHSLRNRAGRITALYSLPTGSLPWPRICQSRGFHDVRDAAVAWWNIGRAVVQTNRDPSFPERSHLRQTPGRSGNLFHARMAFEPDSSVARAMEFRIAVSVWQNRIPK